MPDPKTVNPANKARVRRLLKEQARRPVDFEGRDIPSEPTEEEPPHSPIWWRMTQNQEYTKVTANGKHIPPRGGGIPTVAGRNKPRRTP